MHRPGRTRRRLWRAAAGAGAALGLAALAAGAAEWPVASPDELAAALAGAAAGDTVRVGPGVYPGPLVVDRSLRLVGDGRPVVDGGGRGTVIRVTAPGVEISGFVIADSGDSLDEENSGIAVEAPRAVIADNRFRGVLFGIYLREAGGSEVRGNAVEGKELPLARRGDAIRVWYSDGVTLTDNEVTAARDVVLWYSARLAVRDNRITGGRYGLHFMYCDDAAISGNLLVDNSVGAFLMYSRRLRFTGNTVAGNHGPSGYGVGLKDMDDAAVEANLFAGNRVGIFLDNSPREMGSRTAVEGNLLAANDIGVLMLPNVRRAGFIGNGFDENAEQVAVAGGGGAPEANLWRANYWSDYRGYDGDGDGFGEVPYRSERLFESLADRHPGLRLFAGSPVALALDFASRAFPVVRPQPKLTDPEPAMAPPRLTGVPAVPQPRGAPLAPAAWGLLAAGALVLAAPRLLRPRSEEGAGERADGRRGEGAIRPSGGAAGRPLISARRLRCSFGAVPALDGVSFSIAAGEAVALAGPNGAGKTTALRAILGVLPGEGTLEVAGLDPATRGKEVRRQVGFVPQEMAFQGDLGVGETLAFFGRLRGAPAEAPARLLDELGLAPHRDKRVQELSGGLKQRLALAVALVADPPILLLDEPTANLDREAREDFLEQLARLKGRGKTLVFTSHRGEEIAALADRVLRLAAGRLESDLPAGDPAALPPVELRLQVAPGQRRRAAELLQREGFSPRRLGSRVLALRLPPGRKVEPLARLLAAGVAVTDFSLPETGPSPEEERRAEPA